MRNLKQSEEINLDEAEKIADSSDYNCDTQLFRTEPGRFYLRQVITTLDGKPLTNDKSLYDLAPELRPADAIEERKRRVGRIETVRPVNEAAALAWCVKEFIPDCFRGGLYMVTR
jgi:hypothetical protein